MFQDLIDLVKNLATTLIVVSPTIFIFSVTLLGDAIEKAQLEEKAARDNDAKQNKAEIEKIEISIQQAKQDGDTTELTSKLEILKKNRLIIEKKIHSIKTKYDRISLQNTVLFPTLAFIIVLILVPFASFVYLDKSASSAIIFLLQLLLIGFGVVRLYQALQLVQSISAGKRQSETFDRLRQTVKLALKEHEQSKKEEVLVTFTDKEFPLNIASSTELEIRFRIKLTNGAVLRNTEVWFHMPDEFVLEDPPEASSWRQGPDFNPPNIRTIKRVIGTLSTGPYIRSFIKVKTPVIPGKYLISYKVYADGYDGGSTNNLVLLVS